MPVRRAHVCLLPADTLALAAGRAALYVAARWCFAGHTLTAAAVTADAAALADSPGDWYR